MITLFSSDSNPQYKKDVFNVLALPNNGCYKFRYKSKYICENTKELLNQSDKIENSRALIIFRTNSIKQEVKPFMVPIRWAKIIRVEHIDQIYVISFIICEYPVFNSAFESVYNEYNRNIEFSSSFFAEGTRNNEFVSSIKPDVVLENAKNDQASQEKAWLRIINALKEYNGFSTSFFYSIKLLGKTENNSLIIKENQQKIIEIIHYNFDDSDEHTADVNIIYDKNLIVSVLGDKEKIECRYDKTNYAFIAKDVNHKINTQITFSIKSDKKSTTDALKISVPIVIKPVLKKRFILATISFLGAILIGLNGFLPCLPMKWKSLLFILGSVFISLNWLLSKGE